MTAVRVGADGGACLGTVRVLLEADAPRVNCPTHGPTVVGVPWARHHAGHTLAFDDTVAWLAVACSKTAVCELMRIAWRTVGAIMARVWADTEKAVDRYANLRRIGIDEISYKRHHKYLTVVVHHDSGHLIWAAPGRGQGYAATVFRRFGRRALRVDHTRVRRCRGLDRRCGGRTLPGRDPLRRCVLCGLLGHRGARRRAAPGLERRADAGARRAQTPPRPSGKRRSPQARIRAGPQAQGRALRAVEKSRGPHRTAKREAGLDR